MPNIGSRVRTLRLRHGLRLVDVAERCGFTKSLLSKIETGAVRPPIATLTAIAAALGVPVAALIEDQGAGRTVVDRADEGNQRRTDKGYRYRLLAGSRVEKAMQPFVFTARRGEVRRSPLRHAGEEFVHVISGELDFRVGSTSHRLSSGDSLYFDADEEHDVEPVSAEATWVAVFHEPPKAGKRRRST
jgi:transcriptional regulator with XRE-family HTH domain